jgi:hypothetical protein
MGRARRLGAVLGGFGFPHAPVLLGRYAASSLTARRCRCDGRGWRCLEDVWRVDMTAVMARSEPARRVDSVWDRRHGYEALSVSETKMHAGLRDTDYTYCISRRNLRGGTHLRVR